MSNNNQTSMRHKNHKKMGKAAFAVEIGHLMEWFHFAVHGFFAVIIGQLFFADQGPVVSLWSPLGVVAVGFLMRPLGDSPWVPSVTKAVH